MPINGKKLLYHATKEYHSVIDLNRSRDFLDFGKGYYLTSSIEQAARWALRGSSRGLIIEYAVADECESELKQLPLLECDMKWLDVILYFRIQKPLSDKSLEKEIHSYDVIYDRMADGRISELIWSYKQNKITKEMLLRKVRGWKEQDQYCFKTKQAVKMLTRTKVRCYTDGEWRDWNGRE